jgi:GNAT superfamily N-acetyltransferase
MDRNIKQPDWAILPLNNLHNHKKFKSGDADFRALKTFLQKDALDFQNNAIANTYVVIDDNERLDKSIDIATFPHKVIGFITLICSALDIEDYEFEGCERAVRYSPYPSIKIARLAVDANARRKGIGSLLLDYAILVAKQDIMPKVGCRFLITDAKKAAIQFYESHDMQLVNTQSNKESEYPIMFIDLR